MRNNLTLIATLVAFLCAFQNIFAQLSTFSDEFDDPTTITNWDIHTSGPLAANYYESLVFADSLVMGATPAGVAAPTDQLTIIPGPDHCGWYANTMGSMLSKEVTGNFVVSTYVTLHNKFDYNGLPDSDYNAGGLIARNPNTQGNENYVIANLGYQSHANGVGTETKTTTNGVSTLYLNPDSSRAEMRICRIGDTFRTYKRNPTDAGYIEILELERPDLPPTLQVGIMTNGWDANYNDPPNVRVEYDYIRYEEVSDEAGCTQALLPADCSVPFPVDAGVDVSICNGQSTQLNASGGATYAWNASQAGLSAYNIADPIATPTVTTTYEVTVTHANGCTATDNVTVTVDGCTPIICSLFASDGFDYADLSPLQDLNGGSGWAEPWHVSNELTTVPGYHIDGNTSMNYLDVQTEGNVLSGGLAWTNIGRRLNTGVNSPFGALVNNSGTIGVTGETLYVSALIRKNHDNDEFAFFTVHGNNNELGGSPPEVEVGYFGTDSNVGGIRYWSLELDNTVYPTTVPVTIGETTLLVLEIQFDYDIGHTINVYVNPATLGEDMPAAPTFSQTYNSPTFVIRSAEMRLGNSVGGADMDELRFAGSYECAVPDASIFVNEAPVANFTMDVADGIGPLTVNFDASLSTDDTGIASYDWILGDATTGSGMNVAHTYTDLGVLPVTLTVTDIHGSQHTVTQEIVIRDSNGALDCLTTIQLDNPATCGQADGSFSFYDGYGTSYILSDTQGNTYTPVNDTFDNLAAGVYTFDVAGDYTCTQQFIVHIPTDSTTCAGWQPQDCSLDFGMNLSDVAYWLANRPFKNLMLHSGQFLTSSASTSSLNNSGLIGEIVVDTAGYPIEIPQNTSGGLQRVYCPTSSSGGPMPVGDYVLLYEGQGTIWINGNNIVETDNQAGRIAFTVTGTNSIRIGILSSQLGDHVRNIRIVRPEHEFDDLVANPFYQTYLDHLSNFSTIRFMNWQGINNSNVVEWSERRLPTYHTQASNGQFVGVAYEYIVQLCNDLQKDAWVCVPHLASDDYITQMATFFRDNLDQNLTIYVEYSNELWNWNFAQAQWSNNTRPLNLNFARTAGQRARHTFEIWHNVFGNESNRVQRTLGTNAYSSNYGEEILAQVGANNFDYFSPTWYFANDNDCMDALWDANGAVTPQEVIDCARNRWYNRYDTYRANFWNAKLYGKPVIGYEGGQHISAGGNGGNFPYLQSLYDAQIVPEMYDLYQEVIDSLRVLGMDMAMAYALIRWRETDTGSWGHLETVDQDTTVMPAPKYSVLLDNIVPPCATSPTAPRYVQINALLQGAYDTNGTMETLLTDNTLISLLQPYNQSPWNYDGTEMLTSLPAALTDWVLIELRPENDIETVVNQKAALLLNDGSIVDLAWITDPTVTGVLMDGDVPDGNYHIVVRHRNHLAVISDSPWAMPNAQTINFYDTSIVLGGAPQLEDMGNGYHALTAGDANGDGILSVADFNIYTTNAAQINQYLPPDFNMDGNVTVGDFNLYQPNASKIGVSVVRY